MIASKVLCEETYSTQSWCFAAINMFQPTEINQMESEMCIYLGYNLHCIAAEGADVEALIRV